MKKNITKLKLLKKATIFLSVSVFAIAANAQPVITSVSAAPEGTKLLGYNITDDISHSVSGPAQIWDFSNLAHDSSSFYLVDVPYAGLSQEIKDTFPDGNYASQVFAGGSFATVIGKNTSTYQATLGMAFSPGFNIFPIPDTFLIFPMNYQDVFGNRSYDAYGTLKTPFGTFNNVVRIKKDDPSQNETDYLYIQFEPVYRVLMQYDVDMTTQVVINSGKYFYRLEDFIPSSIAHFGDEANFQIYPNPSNGVFQIRSNQNESVNLTIFNILGKKVYSLSNVHLNTVEIDFSNQPRGMYFININNGKERITRKVLIQ